jgi:heme exporter protein B
MTMTESFKSLWWLIHKDLLREVRAPHVWPATWLLGLVLVFLLAMQIDLPVEQQAHFVAGLLWVSIVFAGTLAMERSFGDERAGDCWQAMVLYPLPPSVLFLGKVVANIASLAILELVLIPLFIVLFDVSLLGRPGAVVLIAALSNLGFAAVGTLISAVTANLRNRGSFAALLFLPLVLPIVLAAAESTAMMLAGEIDQQWWRWIQLLAIFGGLFTVVGALVFEFVVEE